jgi:hypothetical protein
MAFLFGLDLNYNLSRKVRGTRTRAAFNLFKLKSTLPKLHNPKLQKPELANDLTQLWSANCWPFRVLLRGPGQTAQPIQHQIGQNT